MTRKHMNPVIARQPKENLLEEVYVFRRPPEVAGFLEKNSFLISLLFEVYPQIEKYFGKNAPVFLEVVTDPEATDDRELYALIATQLPPEAALEKLERLDKGWWLSAMYRAQCKLSIDVEFL